MRAETALINDDVDEPEPHFDGSTQIDHGEKAVVWRQYDDAVRRAAGYSTSETSQAFEERGFHFGRIDPDVAERAYLAVKSADREPLINDDHVPGYVTYEFPNEVLNETNRASAFRRFDARTAWAIEDALDAAKSDVAACLGTPWKTIAVRAWTTKPASASKGGYGWHSDGYIPELFKILLYLTPLSAETGSVEFRHGGKTIRRSYPERGGFALFKNTERVHRGVAGSVYERAVVDVTLCRSPKFDLRLRSPGQNSHWPTMPWIDDIHRCPTAELHKIDAHQKPVTSLQPAPEKTRGVLARFLRRDME